MKEISVFIDKKLFMRPYISNESLKTRLSIQEMYIFLVTNYQMPQK